MQDVAKPPGDPKPSGETLNYTGTVKDKDTDKPIAGATVVVRRSVYRSEERRVLQESRHTTGADGTYSFTIPPEQVSERYLYIELDVEHPGYATRAGFGYALSMTRKNEKLGERPFFETIEMRPAERITGRVETPEGEPAAGWWCWRTRAGEPGPVRALLHPGRDGRPGSVPAADHHARPGDTGLPRLCPELYVSPTGNEATGGPSP
ncbi:MAG: carboxypeptidase-like regulatory domain-containing protein [Singulisphaera sp.]